MTKQLRALTPILAGCALAALTGCGGGGSTGQQSTVTGTVINAATNLPASGIHVTVYSGSNPEFNTSTNDLGVFTFTNIPVGSHALVFVNGTTELGAKNIEVTSASTDVGDISLKFEGAPPTPPFTQGVISAAAHT